jgi:putative ABC transport system permease protein
MHIQPILAALRRNKAGAILIGLQIALTLAIVCNALFIIEQRLDYLSRPSGLDEQNLFTFDNTWVGSGDSNLEPLSTTDLETVRSTPGVVDAYRSNSFPLRGGGWSTGVNLTPEEQKSKAHTGVYMVDEHALATLGVHLIAGRNFTHDEISRFAAHQTMAPALIIVTKSLADELFPDGTALGKQIYMSTRDPPSTIIGIIEELQTPWVGSSWSDKFARNCLLAPYISMERGSYFVVRTKPGELDKVMKDVESRLNAANRLRVIRKVRTFAETREHAYAKDKGMAVLMGIVCTALLLVTAAGIVGLASFWVGQRQRQIGIRRALGATSRDILHYFQLENVLIGGGGAFVGVLAAVGLNLWLVTEFEMARVPVWYVLSAAAIVMVLGQLAVLQPALRASKVPPVIATRSV